MAIISVFKMLTIENKNDFCKPTFYIGYYTEKSGSCILDNLHIYAKVSLG